MSYAALTAAFVTTLALLSGCSSDSVGAPADGGAESAVTDGGGGVDVSNPFPTSDGAAPPPDTDAAAPETECDKKRAQLLALQALAQACNPQSANPCTAAVDGICCPITVSFNAGSAVNDFSQALTAYQATCTSDCTKVICGIGPTNKCDGTGIQGSCE